MLIINVRRVLRAIRRATGRGGPTKEEERGEPRRVLQVFASLDRGGAEQMILEWYRRVDRSQIQFDFVAFQRDRPYALEETLLDMGARIYKVPYPWGSKFFRSIGSLQRLLLEHPEWRVIHAHYTATAPLIFALGRLQKRRLIAHGHASNRSVQWPLHLASFALAHRNLACSKRSQKRLFGPFEAEVFPNAVDSARFAYDPDAAGKLRDELGKDAGPLLGHVGRFSAEKNHSFLLEVFACVLQTTPDANLILVGKGSLEATMKQKALDLGISESVHFLGVRTDIPRIMSALDLLIMPSVFEGMPITMLEAQASGLPCLVSDAISEDSVIPQVGKVEMLPLSAGSDMWARVAMEMVAADDGDRKTAAEKVTKTPYDITSSAERLLEVYGL